MKQSKGHNRAGTGTRGEEGGGRYSQVAASNERQEATSEAYEEQERGAHVGPSDSREAEVCSCCCTDEGLAESDSIGVVGQVEASDTGGKPTGCSRFSVYNAA